MNIKKVVDFTREWPSMGSVETSWIRRRYLPLFLFSSCLTQPLSVVLGASRL